uniref:pentapeptide repeat-containing protein n=1 Tax=Microbacterium sp. MMO-64 TaxID=3081282 RepID=UPI003019F682
MIENDAPTKPTAAPSPNAFARARERVRGTSATADAAAFTPNEELVAAGLRTLRAPLALFVCQGIADKYGDDWWTDGVLQMFVYSATPTVEDVIRRRKLPASGDMAELSDSLDISACLILLTKQWSRIFGAVLGQDHRGWAYELIGVRNENKHLRGSDHESDYAWRALDTMYRLGLTISPETAEELLLLRSSVDLSKYRLSVAPSTDQGSQAPSESVAINGVDSAPVVQLADDTEQRFAQSEDSDENAPIIAVDFSGADLRRMNFANADLSGANFSDANLEDANFKGACLIGADFTKARLGGANLEGANLSGAHFEGTSLSREQSYGFYG